MSTFSITNHHWGDFIAGVVVVIGIVNKLTSKFSAWISMDQTRETSGTCQPFKTHSVENVLDHWESAFCFRYNSEDLLWSMAYLRKGVKIYRSTCRCTPLPPEMKSLNRMKIFYVRFGMTKVWCTPPQNEKLEICQKKFFGRFGRTKDQHTPSLPPPKKWKVGNRVKIFYGRFGMTKVWCTPSPPKKWKSGKKFYGRFGMTKVEFLIIAQHFLDSFRLAQKNEPCSEGLVQIGWDSTEIIFCQFWS